MKKLLVCLLVFGFYHSFAQKSNIESAVIYLRNAEIEDAKKAIDEAAINPDTKNDPKMWSVRAAVYDTIYRNPEYKKFDNNTEENFVVACLKCMETDAKKRYEDYCSFAVINGAFAAYNKAIEYSQANDAKNALKFFQYVIDVFPYDKNGDLKKNNINEKTITLTMASMALNAKNYPDAKKHLQKLIDMDYNDPLIYLLMANIYYTEGDTSAGLKYTEQGRKRFVTDKDLINQELNIYLSQGRQNELLEKLNEALTIDEENATLQFVRGNVYDNFANSTAKEAKHDKDTAQKISNKAKTEKNAGNKNRLDASVKYYQHHADSLTKSSKTFVAAAETNYKKAIEINPDYLDAYYNLGALNNNKTTEIVEKMNAITSTSQSEYDRKWGAMKKVQDSILYVSVGYFQKALTIAENLPEDDKDKKVYKKETMISLYYSLQQVYANIGDEKKTVEMMNKRKALENE